MARPTTTPHAAAHEADETPQASEMTSATAAEEAAPSTHALMVARADTRLAEIARERDEALARSADARAALATGQEALIADQQRAAAAQETYRAIEREVAQARATAGLAAGMPDEVALVARLERLETARDEAELALTEAMRLAQLREESARRESNALTADIAQAQAEVERLAGEEEALIEARAAAHARLGVERQAAVEATLRRHREAIEVIQWKLATAQDALVEAQNAAPAALAEWPALAAEYRRAAPGARTPLQDLATRWLALVEMLEAQGPRLPAVVRDRAADERAEAAYERRVARYEERRAQGVPMDENRYPEPAHESAVQLRRLLDISYADLGLFLGVGDEWFDTVPSAEWTRKVATIQGIADGDFS